MMILRGHLARIALVRCFQIADKFDTVIKMIYVRMIRFYCTKSTVLQQYMFAYSLKVFCMAAYKLFCFLKFRHILLAFYNVLWYNKYYMKRSIYYVS